MILTPDQRLRVFISSTLDLTQSRAAARRSIESLGLTAVMFEAGARPHPPRALYQAYVEQSDVFVALYSRRYGWTAPGMSVSGLEDEFHLSSGKPRLVYLEADVEHEPKMVSFLERVREEGLSYRRFGSPDELEDLLRADLAVLLTERFHAAPADPRERRRQQAPLPVPLTAFIGRADEVAAIRNHLAGDRGRLLTLVGPGGVGKTRLAVEAVRDLPGFPGGVFFVPLAGLREPEMVADAIAAALDVGSADADAGAVLAVQHVLRDQPALLVLDNFEQVIDAAATVVELLQAAPSLRILVTSRAPLRVRGEQEMELLPLTPAADASPAQSPAVQLFADRAQAVRRDFAVDERSAAAIAEICRELDGLPLAIELAAGTMRVLTPTALLARLRGGSRDLRGGARDAPERHRGLNDAIAWSYELLAPSTRALFAQLSAFRGGFSLETAERVCAPDADVLSGVATLTEHSLVRARVEPAWGARFSMLTTIRHFAADRLGESQQRRAVLDRHASTFLALTARVGLPRGHDADLLDEVELELDNVRRAFEWSLESGDVEAVGEGVWQSWWFWWARGYPREGRMWAARCLADRSLNSAVRARVLTADALLAIWSGDYGAAVSSFHEARPLANEAGDARTLAYADVGVGLVVGVTRSVDEGIDVIMRGVKTSEEMGDDPAAAVGLTAAVWLRGITRQFRDADRLFDQAWIRSLDAGSPLETGIVQAAVAQYRIARGDLAGACEAARDSLEILAGTRHVGSVILTLEVIAEIAMALEATADATVLLGATAVIRSGMATRVPPVAAIRLDSLLETARQRLPGDVDRLADEGSRMPLADAVDLGHTVLDRMSVGTAGRSRHPA